MPSWEVLLGGRCAAVKVVQCAEDAGAAARGTARGWSLRFVQGRMREIAAAWSGFNHGPRAVVLCERVGELHRSRPLLHMKFDLGLGVIAVKCDLLHLGIEGVEAQIPIVGEVRLNGAADRIVLTGIR